MSDNKEIFSSAENFHAHLQQVGQPSEAEPVEKTSETTDETVNQNIPSAEEGEPNVAHETDDETTDETEGAVGAADEGEESYKENKFIPKSRFNKEIEKRRALEEQLAKEREDRIRFETQIQMFQRLQENAASANTAQVQESQIEEFDPLDPDSHKVYMKKINELENKLENIGKETTQKTQQLQYYNQVSAQEQLFEKEHPDFKNALEHLKNVEYEVAKNFYPENQAQEYVAQKLQSAIVSAINSGKNAAETMYKMAKTYGYSSKAETKAAPSANLDAINKNMKTTASIHSLNNSVGLGNNSNIYDIKHAMDKGRIDPDKFHKLIERAKKAAY